MFVTNYGVISNNVTVISDATHAVVENIRVGSNPGGVAYDGAKGEVFVADGGSNNVTGISDATHAVIANIPVIASKLGGAADRAESGEADGETRQCEMRVLSPEAGPPFS